MSALSSPGNCSRLPRIHTICPFGEVPTSPLHQIFLTKGLIMYAKKALALACISVLVSGCKEDEKTAIIRSVLPTAATLGMRIYPFPTDHSLKHSRNLSRNPNLSRNRQSLAVRRPRMRQANGPASNAMSLTTVKHPTWRLDSYPIT